jgi:hypothetical protein
MSAAEGLAVKLGAEGRIALSTAATDLVFGVVSSPAATTAIVNEWVEVCVFGFCLGRVGGVVAVADVLISSGDGELVAATVSGSGTTVNYVVGVALEAGGAAAQKVAIFKTPPGQYITV